ncbi:hypothetical protein AGMMS50222_04010 [Endomicrobiia bacterium]|nr:hypothetical protein AGMMS50222_04010 [Endomicrobiia bacterium]
MDPFTERYIKTIINKGAKFGYRILAATHNTDVISQELFGSFQSLMLLENMGEVLFVSDIASPEQVIKFTIPMLAQADLEQIVFDFAMKHKIILSDDDGGIIVFVD